jgi:hypothetical protein
VLRKGPSRVSLRTQSVCNRRWLRAYDHVDLTAACIFVVCQQCVVTVFADFRARCSDRRFEFRRPLATDQRLRELSDGLVHECTIIEHSIPHVLMHKHDNDVVYCPGADAEQAASKLAL